MRIFRTYTVSKSRVGMIPICYGGTNTRMVFDNGNVWTVQEDIDAEHMDNTYYNLRDKPIK